MMSTTSILLWLIPFVIDMLLMISIYASHQEEVGKPIATLHLVLSVMPCVNMILTLFLFCHIMFGEE